MPFSRAAVTDHFIQLYGGEKRQFRDHTAVRLAAAALGGLAMLALVTTILTLAD